MQLLQLKIGEDGEKMKNIQVTDEIKIAVIKYFGYENYNEQKAFYMNEAPDNLFVFYYNCMMEDIDVCDADRYANLNTVLGYDIGFENFRKIDSYLWCEKDIDLMELSGNEYSKQLIKDVVNVLGIDIDFEKWNYEEINSYVYYI